MRRKNGSLRFTCMDSDDAIVQCATGRTLACDDKADCPSGQVCCGSLDNTTGFDGVSCRATCDLTPNPAFTNVRFCDPFAATDECTSIGKQCLPSSNFVGYAYCQ